MFSRLRPRRSGASQERSCHCIRHALSLLLQTILACFLATSLPALRTVPVSTAIALHYCSISVCSLNNVAGDINLKSAGRGCLGQHCTRCWAVTPDCCQRLCMTCKPHRPPRLQLQALAVTLPTGLERHPFPHRVPSYTATFASSLSATKHVTTFYWACVQDEDFCRHLV